MGPKKILLLITFVGLIFPHSMLYCFVQKIFHLDSGNMGDQLSSLYNAYVYAKKYNLKAEVYPFGGHTLFECSNILDVSPYNVRDCYSLVYVQSEQDIIDNLHQPDIHFYVNVLSDRLAPDPETVIEAKQLLMLNKKIALDDLKVSKDVLNVAVHIRKGNGGVHYDGALSSAQFFTHNPASIRYYHDSNSDPFGYFTDKQIAALRKYTSLDKWWPLKFPPEQYYVDQIKKIVAAKGTEKVVIRIFTDDAKPETLITRLKHFISNPMVVLEYYDNRHKDIGTRIIEDLHLMSQCDILIRAQSGFAIIAEAMGSFKTVIFPAKHVWENKRLMISDVIIRGEDL